MHGAGACRVGGGGGEIGSGVGCASVALLFHPGIYPGVKENKALLQIW